MKLVLTKTGLEKILSNNGIKIMPKNTYSFKETKTGEIDYTKYELTNLPKNSLKQIAIYFPACEVKDIETNECFGTVSVNIGNTEINRIAITCSSYTISSDITQQKEPEFLLGVLILDNVIKNKKVQFYINLSNEILERIKTNGYELFDNFSQLNATTIKMESGLVISDSKIKGVEDVLEARINIFDVDTTDDRTLSNEFSIKTNLFIKKQENSKPCLALGYSENGEVSAANYTVIDKTTNCLKINVIDKDDTSFVLFGDDSTISGNKTLFNINDNIISETKLDNNEIKNNTIINYCGTENTETSNATFINSWNTTANNVKDSVFINAQFTEINDSNKVTIINDDSSSANDANNGIIIDGKYNEIISANNAYQIGKNLITTADNVIAFGRLNRSDVVDGSITFSLDGKYKKEPPPDDYDDSWDEYEKGYSYDEYVAYSDADYATDRVYDITRINNFSIENSISANVIKLNNNFEITQEESEIENVFAIRKLEVNKTVPDKKVLKSVYITPSSLYVPDNDIPNAVFEISPSAVSAFFYNREWTNHRSTGQGTTTTTPVTGKYGDVTNEYMAIAFADKENIENDLTVLKNNVYQEMVNIINNNKKEYTMDDIKTLLKYNDEKDGTTYRVYFTNLESYSITINGIYPNSTSVTVNPGETYALSFNTQIIITNNYAG